MAFVSPKVAVVGAAILILIIFSFQYPVIMSTPIGGDAATHIQRAMDWNLGSVYPLSMALFSASARIIPGSWEMSFMLWTALGHVAVGLMIGLILYRIGGIWPAVFGILFWSAATMEVLPFFRAATMPQLWSMVFLMIMIERFLKGSPWWALITLVPLYYAHQSSFAIGALVIALALPAVCIWRYLPDVFPRRIMALIATGITGAAVLLTFFIFPEAFPYADLAWEEPWSTVLELLATHYGPVLLLAPAGAIFFMSRTRISFPARLTLLIFGILSIMVSVNDMFGGGIPVKRFIPYAVAAAAIFGAIGLDHMARSLFSSVWARSTTVFVILAVVIGGGWQTAHSAYRAFEDGCTVPYPCPAMTPLEREAYIWVNENTPKDAVLLVDEGRGRATEWIRVIANRKLNAFRFSGNNARTVLHGSCEEILNTLWKKPSIATHVVLYAKRDARPESYQVRFRPDIFPVIYENEEVTIYELPDLKSSSQIETLCSNE